MSLSVHHPQTHLALMEGETASVQHYGTCAVHVDPTDVRNWETATILEFARYVRVEASGDA